MRMLAPKHMSNNEPIVKAGTVLKMIQNTSLGS